MKGLALLAISTLFSVSALAGLPAEDAKVGLLRQEFASGRLPHFSLKPGVTQECVFYSAAKNSRDSFHFNAVVTQFGELIRMSISSKSLWYTHLSRDMGFTLTDYGLIAEVGYYTTWPWNPSRPIYANLRESADHKFLVGEMLITLESLPYEARNELVRSFAQSVTHPQGYASAYFACQ